MTEVVQATCVNGDLILEEKLSPQLEGQKVEVTIRPLSESAQQLKRRVSEAQIQRFFEEAKLYSEDMQHNQLIEGKTSIVNPFRSFGSIAPQNRDR